MPDNRPIYALIPACGTDVDAELALMAEARKLADQRGGHAHVVMAGSATEHALAQARAAGLDHAWHIATPVGLQVHQYVDVFATALQTPGLADGLREALVLVIANPDNEALAGALAARLGGAPLGRCTGFAFDEPSGISAQRSAYGNRLDITLSANAGPAIAAVRPQALPSGHSRPTEIHALEACNARAAYPVSTVPRTEQHASVEGASIVISGGRGSGEAAFPALYELAAKVGGAVGASLPAVDAGWAPVTRQIGISGKYVSPHIYVAVGISGTPQHLAGIDPHTRIVAINKDADANIFNVAQIGVVAEWQSLIPALIQALDTSPAH
ncbi:Electron transfer flavoprotein alpha/beta-subunit N-terminal domain-containing protein [Bordetella tumbae]|uniref:electron transfer flavoprotein subunit alpha/FixB family protein n=1 Tax=Bordetella tumbae TaxID=1649139 RepID=UPI0039EE4AA7